MNKHDTNPTNWFQRHLKLATNRNLKVGDLHCVILNSVTAHKICLQNILEALKPLEYSMNVLKLYLQEQLRHRLGYNFVANNPKFVLEHLELRIRVKYRHRLA